MAHILEMPKIARRKKFAELSTHYSSLLAAIMCVANIEAGMENEAGETLVREMTPSETRAGAVLTAMQFFTLLFHIRAKFEEADAPGEPRAALRAFSDECMARCVKYSAKKLNSFEISATLENNRSLKNAEAAYVDAIFGALRVEMLADPMTNEAEFWRDTVLGFGDGDPSGVVGEAGRVLLLDHIEELKAAIADDIQAAAAVTRH